jgi:hypothetical protein
MVNGVAVRIARGVPKVGSTLEQPGCGRRRWCTIACCRPLGGAGGLVVDSVALRRVLRRALWAQPTMGLAEGHEPRTGRSQPAQAVGSSRSSSASARIFAAG